jgi:NAD(P)-dependent dehydrogenase (short-subunit alcohol dehydrogenase family)
MISPAKPNRRDHATNLGIYGPKAFEQITDEDWSRFFEINVLSGVRLSRAYVSGMKRFANETAVNK